MYPISDGQIEVEKMRRAEHLLHKGQEGVGTCTPVTDATSKMAAAASTAVGEGASVAINAQDTPAKSRKRKVGGCTLQAPLVRCEQVNELSVLDYCLVLFE